MIIYWGKHEGKELESLPSHYLCFLIEECDLTDYLIREASKKELVRRLSLDWGQPKDKHYVAHLEKELSEISKLVLFYRKVLRLYAFNSMIAKKYFLNPKLLEADVESMKKL